MIDGHTLVLGISRGGKTTFCEACADWHLRNGIDVLLLESFQSKIPCSFRTQDAKEFIREARKRTRCLLFVDDGSQVIDRYDSGLNWLGAQSRHWGHKFLINTQRYVDINPTIRNNASQIVAFRMADSDAEMVAKDFADGTGVLKTAGKLAKYEFLIGGKYQPFQLKRLKLPEKS